MRIERNELCENAWHAIGAQGITKGRVKGSVAGLNACGLPSLFSIEKNKVGRVGDEYIRGCCLWEGSS